MKHFKILCCSCTNAIHMLESLSHGKIHILLSFPYRPAFKDIYHLGAKMQNFKTEFRYAFIITFFMFSDSRCQNPQDRTSFLYRQMKAVQLCFIAVKR
ncbi:MAG: hypothetical protein LBG21_06765 [Campylobacteraceae bacterium]|nr:hypothetical protein [Campylobacteraceae bacterium]